MRCRAICCPGGSGGGGVSKLCVVKYVLGVMIITCQLSNTYLSAQLQTTYHYEKPFFLLYWHTAFLVLLFPLQYAISYKRWFGTSECCTTSSATGEDAGGPTSDGDGVPVVVRPSDTASIRVAEAAAGGDFGLLLSAGSPEPPPAPRITRDRVQAAESVAGDDTSSPPKSFSEYIEQTTGLTVRRLFELAVPFSLLWMVANFFFLKALSLGDPASCLSLEQLATVFIFLLSIWILPRPPKPEPVSITAHKIGGILCCVVGVVVQAFGDEQQQSTKTASAPLVADGLVIVSAFAAALYMVGLKRYVVSNKPAPATMRVASAPAVTNLMPGANAVFIWLAAIGTVSALLYWPMFPIFDASGLELFEWPGDVAGQAGVGLFLAGSVLSFGFNYSLNVGVSISSPLFIRLVTIVTVPVGLVISAIIHSRNGDSTSGDSNALRVFGALLICFGFVWFAIAFERAPAQSASGTSHPPLHDQQLLSLPARRVRTDGDDSAVQDESTAAPAVDNTGGGAPSDDAESAPDNTAALPPPTEEIR